MNRTSFKSASPIPAPATRATFGDMRWSGEGRLVQRATSAIGKFVELCDKLPGGLKESWEMQTTILTSTQQRG